MYRVVASWPKSIRNRGVGRLLPGLMIVVMLHGCAEQATVTRGDDSTSLPAESGPAGTTVEPESAIPPPPAPIPSAEQTPTPEPAPIPEPAPEPAVPVRPAPAPAAQPKSVPEQTAPPKSAPTPRPEPASKSPERPKPVTAPQPVTTSKAEKDSAEAIPVVELEKLPLAVNSNWTLDAGRDPVSKRNRCFLRSTTLRIEDGQGGSSISLIITADTLRIVTRSNVDLSYRNTGLQVDSNTAFPLQGLFGETDVLFDRRVSEITQQMRNGSSVTVTLGFWPTWPVTQAYSARFPISGYATASAALRTCDSLTP